MSIVSFLLLAVFAFLAVIGVRTLTVPAVAPAATSATDGAIAKARRRLDRGEIDAYDFERIVAVLRGCHPRT